MTTLYFNVFDVQTEELVKHLKELKLMTKAMKYDYLGPLNGTTCQLIFEDKISLEELEKSKEVVKRYLEKRRVKHIIKKAPSRVLF